MTAFKKRPFNTHLIFFFLFRGEDDRERLESSRSNEDHKADQDDKRSRASSTSDKFPAASPSPIHGRRRG